jgi:hypothetical protein
MKRAFKQYVDKKFTFPDPTEEDFEKLLEFAEKRNDKSLDDFLAYLKRNKCSRNNSLHRKDAIDNRCSFRHPLEDDKRISEFRNAFRDYVNLQIPFSENDLKNLLDYGRSLYGNDLWQIFPSVKQGKCSIKDHIDERTNKQPINNSCFFRHPFETDERILRLRKALYEYYLKNLQEEGKRRTTRSRGGSGSQGGIPRRSSSTMSRGDSQGYSRSGSSR